MVRSADQDIENEFHAADRDQRRNRRRGRVSGLTGKILLLNILALAILVSGILYFNQFRSSLVQTRLGVLITEAQMVAAALGESASGGADTRNVDVGQARAILQRLTVGAQNRGRLFGLNGDILLDSRLMVPNSQVLTHPLLPPDEMPGIGPTWTNLKAWLIKAISTEPDYPPYFENVEQKASDYVEVLTALQGDMATAVRLTDHGTLMLHVAIPVQRFHRVLGAVLVSVETTEIEEVVRQERLAILEVFGVALVVTALLSMFLAGTIARPVRRLADFAHQVRLGRGRDIKMPDFTGRQDELGDLSRALRDMTRALYRRIDAIEAFAADVSHELKNPLSSLHSAIETLDLDADPSQQRKLLAIIKDDVNRLNRLITDISNASRLDAELLRGEMASVDLAAMLATIIEIYQETTQDQDVTLSLELPDEPLVITGIEGHLGQVIRNLIDNALSFSPPGGTIQIAARKVDNRIRVEIMDEGPGIGEDKLEAIFDRFYTERPEEDGFGTHSGLGLNICKQIVAVHSGEIWAENLFEPGDLDRNRIGANFIISLPSA
ncbi:MAG: HAMP domain-containing protein [Alphaproteobacteria bacterium]|nr:MAG: HAMP domain-containing protein [Alphaproteobacteria bacterium]